MGINTIKCPNFSKQSCSGDGKIHRDGKFFRKNDGRWIQRFRCSGCGKRFSAAYFDPAYRQNKRRINHPLARLLSSGVSMRRCALILGVARKTIERKLRFLGTLAKVDNDTFLLSLGQVESFQFDDLQTIEHTKLKPLSVTLAVETSRRKILGFEVSRMPATGHLSEKSRRKYGFRKDERPEAIKQLLRKVRKYTISKVKIRSDEHPFYTRPVLENFPEANYERIKGVRGCVVGQGELKKIGFDPLFSLNHTCAMLRANINRLIRKTWCTTKDPARLIDHLNIYMKFHNTVLTS